jgi:hypothetical protein
VRRLRLVTAASALAGAASLLIGLPAASGKRLDSCSLDDTSLHWEAVFGHVTSLDEAIVQRKRLAKFGFRNIGFERDYCDDIELQIPGLDTATLRASFWAQASRAHIPVSFEAPDIGKQLGPGEVNAVFGRFPTLKRANALLMSMATVGFRENADIVRLDLHSWKVVMYKIPRSVSSSFAAEAKRAHFSVTFEG